MAAVNVREYVKSVVHAEGCKRRHCGPACVRETDGWEYHLKLVLPDGSRYEERKRSPARTRADTQRYADQRAAHILRFGRPTEKEATKAAVPTLAEFAPRYISDDARAKRNKPRTIAEKQRIIDHDLVPRFGSTPLDRIDDAMVAKMMSEMAEKSPATVNNVLSVLSTMHKAAYKWKVIEMLPCTIEHLRVVQREIEYYEPDVYEHLLASARNVDPRIALLVLLGGDAGLRCGEIIALEQDDVDFTRGFIHVQRSESEGYLTVPKGGRDRRVDMTRRLSAALKANRHIRGKRVLWRDDGRAGVTQVLLAKWMRRAERKAGLEVTGRIHILRHTFCSRLAMAGAPALAIKEQAGHAHLTTTQRYMHLSPKAKRRAVELLDEMVGDVEMLGDIKETAHGT